MNVLRYLRKSERVLDRKIPKNSGTNVTRRHTRTILQLLFLPNIILVTIAIITIIIII